MMQTLGRVVDVLEQAHIRYLEATYHLSNPGLVDERRRILETPGTLFADPWIEAPPSYVKGSRYEDVDFGVPDLGTILAELAPPKLNPPYKHQEEAIRTFHKENKELVVATGTGSGKTEVFLYSIVGHLLREPQATRHLRGIRAMVLYPMNALVSDQLARLRRMLGSGVGAASLRTRFKRTIRFAMYTGRTPYHGRYDTEKNNRRVGAVLRKLQDLQGTPQYRELEEKGRIPAKDIDEFIRKRGIHKYQRFRTLPNDAELYTRQEVLEPRTPRTGADPEDCNPFGGTPDLLVTNYSMLEYTLLRPIEQSIWDDTRQWLDANPENKLLVVLDEAHLYRGAQGTEISLLLARFANHLGVKRDRLRFILTSASIGTPAAGGKDAQKFAADLTNGSPNQFSVVRGYLTPVMPGTLPPPSIVPGLQTWSPPSSAAELSALGTVLGIRTGNSATEPAIAIGEGLEKAPWYGSLVKGLTSGARPLSTLAADLWPSATPVARRNAARHLLSILTWARRSSGEPLLPIRLHLMLRGIVGIFACLNPKCTQKQTASETPVGALYTAPRGQCDCGGRVFELWSHRDCGAAFIHAYKASVAEPGRPEFLWSGYQTITEDLGHLQEVALLVEHPRHPSWTSSPPRFMGTTSGLFATAAQELPGETAIPVWEAVQGTNGNKRNQYVTCPMCDQGTNPGGSFSGEMVPFGKIQDLQTKGEAPFANVVRTLFEQQPDIFSAEEGRSRQLPNRGKKVLCFSDSRQKAARLARDLQQTVETDAFREIVALAIRRANDELAGKATFEAYYTYLFEVAKDHQLSLFDGRGKVDFATALDNYATLRSTYEITDLVGEHSDQVRALVPAPLHSAMLRALSDTHYSLHATMVAMPTCGEDVTRVVVRTMQARGHANEDLVRSLLQDLLLRMFEDAAVNPDIPSIARRRTSQKFWSWSDQDMGLQLTDLFPNWLVNPNDGVTRPLLDDLTNSVRTAGLVLAGPNGRFFLSPRRFKLGLAKESERWFQCTICARPTPATFANQCPWRRCQGPLQEVTAAYAPLAARKDLFRKPAMEVSGGARPPYTLRAEEHTAQLNAFQDGELHGRAERYELLFQDVLLESADDPRPRAIDVLSCTTTMEVGIDIGSVTAVALRTVPPRPDNYQQRAGRAGRRGSALATILTYADLSPYEQNVFENPGRVLIPEALAPILHTSNENIVQRHLYASFLQFFFFRTLPDGSTWRQRIVANANLFESLGTCADFFSPGGPHEYDFNAFQNWVSSEIAKGPSSRALTDIQQLVPKVDPPSAMATPMAFVTSSAQLFIAKLAELSQRDLRHPDGESVSFIEALIRSNLRPAFGFPLDLCTFSVRGRLNDSDKAVKVQYEPQQDLQVALTEYAPGRELVIDKQDFTSYGLHVDFPQDAAQPAASIAWDNLSELVQCLDCDSVLAFDVRGATFISCEACGSAKIRTYPYHRPAGFSPALENREWIMQRQTPEQDPAAAVSAKLPTPDLRDTSGSSSVPPKQVGPVSTLVHARNQRLVVSNLGQEDDGYRICRSCGAIDPPQSANNQHYRPHPIPPWLTGPNRCASVSFASNVAFAHGFRTDIAMLRIVANQAMDYNPRSPWMQASAISLAEALGLAAVRRLKLERGEIKAGWRPLQRDVNGTVERLIDIYLYDGTPGGAGFASRSYLEIDGVLDEAASILSTCSCERACNKCILTFDNKNKVEFLDRFAALSLLGYARTGAVPDVPLPEQERLAANLELLIRKKNGGNSCTRNGSNWIVNLGRRQVDLTIRPVLRQGDTGTIVLTDYEIRANPVGQADFLLSYS